MDIKHGGGEEMPGMYLNMCYACIFEGLPLMQLQKYDSFIQAHEHHDPLIETLGDFVQHYNDVMAMFLSNNLAEEYASMSARDPETFPAAPARLSPDGIADALLAMRRTIVHLGPAAVEAAISGFVTDFLVTAEHPDRDPGALNSHVRALLTSPPENTWELAEQQISPLQEQLSVFDQLINVLEAVSGHKCFWGQRDQVHVGEEEDSQEDEDVAVEQEPWDSEKPMLVKVRMLFADMQEYYPSTTEPSPRIKTCYKHAFQCYDSFYASLVDLHEYLFVICRHRNHGAAADEWLEFFLTQLHQFTEEVKHYWDRLNSLKNGRVPCNQMSEKLLILLVCLFLTPAQIRKLKSTPPIDQNIYIAFDDICEHYAQDVQGNRKFILSELERDALHGDNWLKTSVYMVSVDIVSVWSPEDFPSNWRRIYYWHCLPLLKFAKAETVDTEHQITKLREPWQTFLRQVVDETGEQITECEFCCRNLRDVIYMPCGHFISCHSCAASWRLKSDRCPYCKTTVTSIDSVRKYVSDGKKTIPFKQNARFDLGQVSEDQKDYHGQRNFEHERVRALLKEFRLLLIE